MTIMSLNTYSSLHVPSFAAGVVATLLLSPVINCMLGNLLVGLITICKFGVIIGAIGAIWWIFNTQQSHCKPRIETREPGHLNEKSTLRPKAPYRYFDIPVVKADEGTERRIEPLHDKAGAYQEFVNKAHNK